MPTIALTGVRMMLMALKMMLTKVKTRPMMRKAYVVRAIYGCTLVVFWLYLVVFPLYFGCSWFFLCCIFAVVCSTYVVEFWVYSFLFGYILVLFAWVALSMELRSMCDLGSRMGSVVHVAKNLSKDLLLVMLRKGFCWRC